MGAVITLPAEYLDINKKLMNLLWVAKASGDFSTLFSAAFLQEVYALYPVQEAFIREQFVSQGNYILDPTGVTDKRWTGHYLLWFHHSLIFLINAKVNNPAMMDKRRQLFLDLEPYLRAEGTIDGNCLALLTLVPRVTITTRTDTAAGWAKYQEIAVYMKSIDTDALDWVSGSWQPPAQWGGINGWTPPPDWVITVDRTPESTKKASTYYWKAYIDIFTLMFNEAYLPENVDNTVKAIDRWAETLLMGAQDPSIVAIYAPYIQKALPSALSLFEKIIAASWLSDTMDPLYKIELITKIFAAYSATYSINNGAFSEENINQFNVDKGLEIIPKIEGWLTLLLIEQLSIPDNSSKVDALLTKLKGLNAFGGLKANLLAAFQQIESLPTLLGRKFPAFYHNAAGLKDPDVKAMVADRLAAAGLSQPANELMSAMTDPGLQRSYPTGSQDVAFILTTAIAAGDELVIDVVHNMKNGSAAIALDFADGSSDAVTVEVADYFSRIPVAKQGPVVVRTAFDIALVNVVLQA
ncbi:MAG: hypothetical protein P4N59_17955 [Negativicutes bacterium]|nr:hypothetical protein [Negativicutes bacterium]